MIVFKNRYPQDPLVVSRPMAVSNHDPSIRSFHSHSGRAAAGAGFTLIEVLLALAIIGLVLTPIFVNQTSILRSSSYRSRLLGQIFLAKKVLVETEFSLAPEAQEYSTEKKIDNPPTTFKYSLKKIPENSELKKFKDVLIETVSWSDRDKKRNPERIITFLYKPEQKQ